MLSACGWRSEAILRSLLLAFLLSASVGTDTSETQQATTTLADTHTTSAAERVDECAAGLHNCHANATCSNSEDSFMCTCIAGYIGDGLSCDNLDECASNPCTNQRLVVKCSNGTSFFLPAHAIVSTEGCIGTLENYTDVCPPIHTCLGEGAYCLDTQGSFECVCSAGYEQRQNACYDVNECAKHTDNCHAQATCTDTPGSFTCTCETGYVGDGLNCTNRNECREPAANNCNVLARCVDSEGSFSCSCGVGYQGDGIDCTYAPRPGSDVGIVKVVFTVVLPFARLDVYTDTALQYVYRRAVAQASGSAASLVHIRSIDEGTGASPPVAAESGRRAAGGGMQEAGGGRREAGTSAVHTQMVLPQQQFEAIQKQFAGKLTELLARHGVTVLSIPTVDVHLQADQTGFRNGTDAGCQLQVVIGASTGGTAGFVVLCIFVYLALKLWLDHTKPADKKPGAEGLVDMPNDVEAQMPTAAITYASRRISTPKDDQTAVIACRRQSILEGMASRPKSGGSVEGRGKEPGKVELESILFEVEGGRRASAFGAESGCGCGAERRSSGRAGSGGTQNSTSEAMAGGWNGLSKRGERGRAGLHRMGNAIGRGEERRGSERQAGTG